MAGWVAVCNFVPFVSVSHILVVIPSNGHLLSISMLITEVTICWRRVCVRQHVDLVSLSIPYLPGHPSPKHICFPFPVCLLLSIPQCSFHESYGRHVRIFLFCRSSDKVGEENEESAQYMTMSSIPLVILVSVSVFLSLCCVLSHLFCR